MTNLQIIVGVFILLVVDFIFASLVGMWLKRCRRMHEREHRAQFSQDKAN